VSGRGETTKARQDEPFAEQFDLLLVHGIEQGEPPVVFNQLITVHGKEVVCEVSQVWR
jgi:hypothetical protein